MALLLLVPIAPQTTVSASSRLQGILAALRTGSWQERAGGLSELLGFRREEGAKHPEFTPAINEGLIGLLDWENAASRVEVATYGAGLRRAGPGRASTVSVPGTEAESEFLAELIGTVADLRDPRALPVLLDDIETGGMATDGIAYFGEAAVPKLMEMLDAKSPGSVVCLSVDPKACLEDLHSTALLTLSTIAGASPPGSPVRAEVRRRLAAQLNSPNAPAEVGALNDLRYLKDPTLEPLLLEKARRSTNAGIRMDAVLALGALKDPKLRPALTGIAQSDPDKEVRAAAGIVLQDLGGRP